MVLYQKGQIDASILIPLLTKVLKLEMEKEEDLVDPCIGALCYTHGETKAQREKAISLGTRASLFVKQKDVPAHTSPLPFLRPISTLLSLFIGLRQGPNRTGFH